MILIIDMVTEKYKGLKLYQTLFGLNIFTHITQYTIYNLFLTLIFTTCNMILILTIDNLLINNVDILFWFLYFFCSMFAMNVFAMFINSIVSTGKSALTTSYAFLLFSFVF